MGRKGKKYAQAKHFKRVLPAYDRRPQSPTPEERPIVRGEPDGNYCEREKMRKAQYVQIHLIDRVNELLQPARHKLSRAGQVPGQRDEKREHKVSNSNPQGQPRAQYRGEPLRAAQRTPGAEYE